MDENGSNQNLAQHNNLCRSGCGFYGNSSFEGMCSKCYKDSVQRRNQNPSPIQVQGLPTQTDAVLGMLNTMTLNPLEQENPVASAMASSLTNLSDSVKSSVAATAHSVETASPTVPSTSPASSDKEDSSSAESAEGAAAAPAVATEEKEEEEKDKKPPKKNRCRTCKKKVGLTGFMCRCGGLYCGLHRYSDKHECTFDYKELAQQQLRKANPVIVCAKLNKI